MNRTAFGDRLRPVSVISESPLPYGWSPPVLSCCPKAPPASERVHDTVGAWGAAPQKPGWSTPIFVKCLNCPPCPISTGLNLFNRVSKKSSVLQAIPLFRTFHKRHGFRTKLQLAAQKASLQ